MLTGKFLFESGAEHLNNPVNTSTAYNLFEIS